MSTAASISTRLGAGSRRLFQLETASTSSSFDSDSTASGTEPRHCRRRADYARFADHHTRAGNADDARRFSVGLRPEKRGRDGVRPTGGYSIDRRSGSRGADAADWTRLLCEVEERNAVGGPVDVSHDRFRGCQETFPSPQRSPDPTIRRPVRRGGLQARSDELDRFRRYRRTQDPRVRDELVTCHLGLAEALACRHAGLAKSGTTCARSRTWACSRRSNGVDPDRGVAFSSFAVPTILGELKRHFRDQGWTIRVPRRLQELRRHAEASRQRLQQQSGGSPGYAEVADDLGEDPAEVRSAMEDLTGCYQPTSLDDPGRRDLPDDSTCTESMACTGVEVQRLLASLAPRERRIFMLRYYGAPSQQEIADRIGLSQMHVSRLLRAGLNDMRAGLDDMRAAA